MRRWEWKGALVVMRETVACVVALLSAGCIFAEPPIREREQTAPVFDLRLATPSISRIIQLAPNDAAITITVPFRSEDAGEPVFYSLLSIDGTTETHERHADQIDPSTYSDTSREIKVDWTHSNQYDRCFQLMLVACHVRNIVYNPTVRCAESASEDTAVATWWVSYGNVDEPPSLAECGQ